MAAHGGTILASSGVETTSLDTENLNVTGSDLALICGGCEENNQVRTLTLVWDPAGNNESMTGTFATLSPGTYLDATLAYLDNPTAANAPIRLTLSAGSLCTVFGSFFTAAGDIVVADTANDSDATTSSSLTATPGNVVTDDMVIDWMCKSSTGAPTIGANQTDQGSVNAGNYLRSHVSTQAGSDGGVMSWTALSANYGALLIAARVPDAGGGGGGLTMPIAVHHMNQMRG